MCRQTCMASVKRHHKIAWESWLCCAHVQSSQELLQPFPLLLYPLLPPGLCLHHQPQLAAWLRAPGSASTLVSGSLAVPPHTWPIMKAAADSAVAGQGHYIGALRVSSTAVAPSPADLRHRPAHLGIAPLASKELPVLGSIAVQQLLSCSAGRKPAQRPGKPAALGMWISYVGCEVLRLCSGDAPLPKCFLSCRQLLRLRSPAAAFLVVNMKRKGSGPIMTVYRVELALGLELS